MEGGAISPWVQLAPQPSMGWMGLKCLLGLRSLLVNARPSWMEDREPGVPRQGWQHACNQDRVQLQDRNFDAQMSPGRCARVPFSAVMADFGQNRLRPIFDRLWPILVFQCFVQMFLLFVVCCLLVCWFVGLLVCWFVGPPVEHTFIQNRFHPMTLSSKHDFIQ